MAKKGSLSLSVNAIVVLVLALTMLGVGISFTKNMFGKLGSNLLDKADYTELPDPNADNPISTLQKVSVNIGDKKVVPVKVYNPSSGDATMSLEVTCNELGSSGSTSTFLSNSGSTSAITVVPGSGLSVGGRKVGSMGFIVTIPSSFSGVDLCTLTLKSSSSSSSTPTTIGSQTVTFELK